MAATSQPDGPAATLRGRAILVGAVLVPVVSLWVAGMENIYGGRPTYLSIFFHAVILLAVLQGLNALLRVASPRFAFSRAELLLIYVMVGASSGIVGDQFLSILVPSLSFPFRYATEANQWESRLWPHLPEHAMVSDPIAVRNLYEGRSSLYMMENLGPWLAPALMWAGFIAVTQLMCLGIGILIRKQWTQHEKLSFPLVSLPMEMTAPGAGSLWRNKLMWLGFASSGSINLINGLNMHYPQIPLIKVKVNYLQFTPRWSAALTTTGIAFYPFIIGIAYFLPSDLTFSTWFFLLFFRLQRFAFSALGYESPYPWKSTGYSMWPAMQEQGIGSYIAVVVFAAWAARIHLASVWQAIWQGAVETGDPRTTVSKGEVVEYRLALGVIAGGLALTTWFAVSLTMPVYIGLVYILLYLVVNTAIAKVRAEAGAPTHGFHYAGPDHVLLTFTGATRMRATEMAAWGLFFGFNRAYTGVPMPHAIEGMKMGEMLGADRQRMTGSVALAMVLGCFAGFWALLHLCFREGIEQMGHPVRDLSPGGWHIVNTWIQNPTGPNWVGLGGIVVGFLFSYFLMNMRFRFVWWPFHPIGYAIAADWTTGLIWLPLLLGWLVKTLVMRYLGPRSYILGLPLALGVVLGEFAVGGFWSILAMITRRPQYAFWT